MLCVALLLISQGSLCHCISLLRPRQWALGPSPHLRGIAQCFLSHTFDVYDPFTGRKTPQRKLSDKHEGCWTPFPG